MTSTTIDMAVVDELLELCDDGDAELLVDLIEMFLEDAPDRLSAIEDGLRGRDLEAVERAAHSLKGSAGNLGAHHVQHLSEAIQVASRNGEAATVLALASTLRTRFDEAEHELRDLLDRFAAA